MDKVNRQSYKKEDFCCGLKNVRSEAGLETTKPPMRRLAEEGRYGLG